MAWSFGLEVGAAQAHDVGAGDVKISSDGDLPLVDQTAICLAGHQAQALIGFRCLITRASVTVCAFATSLSNTVSLEVR